MANFKTLKRRRQRVRAQARATRQFQAANPNFISQANDLLKAMYLGPVREMLNGESVLLGYLKR